MGEQTKQINQIPEQVEEKNSKKMIWILIAIGIIIVLLIIGFVVYSLNIDNKNSENQNTKILSEEEYFSRFGENYNPLPIEG